jgi:hypothetical protein
MFSFNRAQVLEFLKMVPSGALRQSTDQAFVPKGVPRRSRRAKTRAGWRWPRALTSHVSWCGVLCGDDMANKSQFSIVTYERRPGHWRAAITPLAQSGSLIRGKATTSVVTGEDSRSESDAMLAAEQLIKTL